MASQGLGDDSSRPPDPEPSATFKRPAYDPHLVRKTVEFWERRELKDPEGAIARRNLAAAYLARQRETGQIEDAVRAERAARASLKLSPRSNASALNRLANVLLTSTASPRHSKSPSRAAALDPEAERLRADILLELGDYEAARKAMARFPSGRMTSI